MGTVAKIAGVTFSLACFATVVVIGGSGEALFPMDTFWQRPVRGLSAYLIAVAWLALGVGVLLASGIGVSSARAESAKQARDWAFVLMGAAFVAAGVVEALRLYGNVAF